jgi:adenylate kinase family enzyme
MEASTDTAAPSTARRIIVVGDSCSGKSTLAQWLASVLDAPFLELDALYWRPNWTPAPDEELLTALHEIAANERWVVAGNYLRLTQPTLWPRAQLMIWLDLPLHVVLPRMARRTWRRWRTRELLWGTNVEDPWQHLRLWETDKNLFTFTLRRHGPRRAEYAARMHDPHWAHIDFVRLCSIAEIDTFARTFEEHVGRSRD